MKIITSRLTLFLGFLLVLFNQTNIFAQWVKQSLPATKGTFHMQLGGTTVGKNVMWMETRDMVADTTRVSPVEYVRTIDGGKTYQTGNILPNNDEYYYNLQPFDANTAYLPAFHYETGVSSIFRTVNGGTTWAELPYHAPTFLNAAIFYDANNGFILCDPDSIGAFFAHTTDGGATFTRVPQGNIPQMNAHEIFLGGGHQLKGNTMFQPSLDTDNGLTRIWRSTDRGQHWTAGEWFNPDSGFGPTTVFTDNNNGILITGITSLDPQSQEKTYFTTDGGHTWQDRGGSLPGRTSGGYLSALPNTQTIVGIFEDIPRKILFSAATNDFGKTWNTRKDLVPYKLDSIYTQFGLPAFAWTNLEIIDNHTAWAKFSRTELYRYDSPTPIIPEQPDLDLVLKADNDGLPLYGSVKYTLTVTNRGISPATGIRINWLPPYKRTNNGVGPYAYQAAYSDKGRYDSWNGVWTLDKLDAGAIATASFHLFVLDNTKDVSQTAQVVAANEKDLDSAPNNMVGAAKEDDEIGYVAKAINSTANMPNDAFKVKLPEFAVSPNPAKDKIYVAINPATEGEWSIRILNNIGQVVFNQNGQYNNRVEVDAKNFDAGLYLVEYQAQGERKVEKVMIQH